MSIAPVASLLSGAGQAAGHAGLKAAGAEKMRLPQNKKPGKETGRCLRIKILLLVLHFLLSSSIKAVAAIYRSVIARFKRYLGYYAALRTYRFMHFTLGCAIFTAIAAAASGVAAFTATCRLVFKTLFGVELLFACSKNEILPALFALESFVLESH